jgi:hypothetical protein
MFNGTYKPDTNEAQKVHRLLNRYVFNNALRKTRFNIKNLKDIWAMCDGRVDRGKFFTEQIFLTNKFPHKAMFVTAIAHEMVHQWQWEVYSAERYKQGKSLIMSHGPSFYQWKKPLAEYMIPLSIKI